MRIRSFLSFLIITSVLVVACGDKQKTTTKWAKGEYKDIDATTAKVMLDNNPDIVVIDVRTPEEVSKGKIKDALELNILDADFEQQIKQLDKSKPYMVYCVSGTRSGEASKLMQNQKFVAVYNLVEGYGGYLRAQEK